MSPRSKTGRQMVRSIAAATLGRTRRISRTNPFAQVEVNHYTLAHPSVDDRTQGLTVAHLTDIHYGPWVRGPQIEMLVAYVNAQEVDLVTLTGDYVGHRRRDIAPCLEPMGDFVAPTFATLGNHDHVASARETWRVFETIGVPVLTNEATVFRSQQGHELTLVGVDDAFTRHHDVPRAFAKADTDSRFCLTLSHVPEIGPDLANHGADLILSGHTHGLQFDTRFVRRLARRIGMTLIMGDYLLNDASMLYVSQGLGSDLFPWRYRTRPEIAIFRLVEGTEPILSLEHQRFLDLTHR
ncbi:MAG: metallophosphoesterase [Myxococcota bacterium]